MRPLVITCAIVAMLAVETSAAPLAPLPRRFAMPEGLVAATDGTLYLTEAAGDGTIWRLPFGTSKWQGCGQLPSEKTDQRGLLGLALDEARGLLYSAAPSLKGGSVFVTDFRQAKPKPRLLKDGLGKVNGLALTSDGRTLYISDISGLGLRRGRVWQMSLGDSAGAPPRTAVLRRTRFPNGLAVWHDAGQRRDILFVAHTIPGRLSAWDVTARNPAKVRHLAREGVPGFLSQPDGLLVLPDASVLAVLHGRGAFLRFSAADFLAGRGLPKALSLPPRDPAWDPQAPKEWHPASVALLPGESLAFTEVGRIIPRQAAHRVYVGPLSALTRKP